jgi:hypothetical protein
MCDLNVSEFNSPTIYFYNSLEECIKAAEDFGWDQEGFVACDENYNRVKIKSPAYVLAHYMRNNNVINKRHLIKVILMNEVEEFLCYAEEYKDCILECQRRMKAFHLLGNSFAHTCRKARSMPRREYAELVKTFPKIFQSLLFYNYDNELLAEEYTAGWNELRWEEYIEEMEKLEYEYFNP